MTEHLEAAGVRIPLVSGWDGYQIRPGAPFDQLGWVVGQWTDGRLPELLERVTHGEDAEIPGFAAVRPRSPLEPEEVAPWKALTGQEIGDDPVVVYCRHVLHGMAFPRAALVEILRAFQKLRDETAHLPRPEHPPPAPLAPDQSLPPKQLYTRTPSADQPPTEYERESMGDLDDMAVALDAAQSTARSADERADVTVKRRVLLEEMEAQGLLDEARQHEKRAWLECWRMPTLRDYVGAAIALRRYFASTARATYGLPAPPARLLDGAVSLDWFRRPGPTPDGATPETWLAFCEQVLHENPPGGASGEVLSKVGGRWYQIHWRREAGEHATVVAASELVR